MTAVRTDALAQWDSADEAARRAVVEHALARAQRAFEEEVSGGMACEFRHPTLEIVRAQASPFRVTVATSFRVYHYAQSGSDWSIQTITIVQATVAAGVVDERVLYESERNISEGNSDDHDDDREMRETVDAWLRDRAPLIEQALEAAGKRARAGAESLSGGWPYDLYGSPTVEVIEAAGGWKRTTVRTVASERVYIREQSGSDSFRVYAAVDEIVFEDGKATTKTLVARETGKFSENESHDDAELMREAVAEWRKKK